MAEVKQEAQTMMATGRQLRPKPLIEPKQVEVEKFTGAIMDSRSKFLSWGERVKDRAELFDPNLAEIMTKIEGEESPISLEKGSGH